MTIKHIVIPGGGPIGVQALGAIQYLEQQKYIDVNMIDTIYATSIGTIVATLIALKFEWNTINDYIIKRPWQDVFQINISQIFDIFSKKGLFDKNSIEIFFKPFFNAKDIPLDITLLDFYNFSNIELHIFSLETNKFSVIDCSYKTHPQLPLITAIHMSCAIPILFSPVCIDNNCYVDGGVVCNDPLNYCIDKADSIDEIFALCNDYSNENTDPITGESSLLEFLINIINKLLNNVSNVFDPKTIANQLIYKSQYMSLSYLQKFISSQSVRQELLDYGINCAREYLENKNLSKEDKYL
jgi:predicted acylesterase/phospholipase RssA